MRSLTNKFHGVVNGIDDKVYNPATDPHLEFYYSPDNVKNKAVIKTNLRRHLGMSCEGEDARRPLVSSLQNLSFVSQARYGTCMWDEDEIFTVVMVLLVFDHIHVCLPAVLLCVEIVTPEGCSRQPSSMSAVWVVSSFCKAPARFMRSRYDQHSFILWSL